MYNYINDASDCLEKINQILETKQDQIGENHAAAITNILGKIKTVSRIDPRDKEVVNELFTKSQKKEAPSKKFKLFGKKDYQSLKGNTDLLAITNTYHEVLNDTNYNTLKNLSSVMSKFDDSGRKAFNSQELPIHLASAIPQSADYDETKSLIINVMQDCLSKALDTKLYLPINPPRDVKNLKDPKARFERLLDEELKKNPGTSALHTLRKELFEFAKDNVENIFKAPQL